MSTIGEGLYYGTAYEKKCELGCGYRVNISKSGVGYSWGVPGFRIAKTAKGKVRKTYSVPGSGLSYADEPLETGIVRITIKKQA